MKCPETGVECTDSEACLTGVPCSLVIWAEMSADCEKYGHPESPNQYPDGTIVGHCPCGMTDYVHGEPVSRETKNELWTEEQS